jgi:hypothetical protein
MPGSCNTPFQFSMNIILNSLSLKHNFDNLSSKIVKRTPAVALRATCSGVEHGAY